MIYLPVAKSNNDKYDYIEELVINKKYEKLLNEFRPFLLNHLSYIKNRLKVKSSSTDKLNNFLIKCGKESYFCIKQYYCESDEKEIWSDIYISFITLINRYTYKERNFTAYLYNTFYFEFGRVIFQQMREMVKHDGYKAYLSCICDNLYDEKDNVDYNLDKLIGYESVDGYLTEKWIDDDKNFNLLNKKERQILLMYYQEKMSNKSISEKLHCHINSISNCKNVATNKLSKYYKIKVKRTRNNIRKT